MSELKSKTGGSSLALTILVIILWYAANILTLLSNKWLLSSSGFRQPVFLTLCHMTACSIMGYVASKLSPSMALRPIKSKQQFYKICFLAVIFCSTIVLGNASLKYLHVSFTQMIGATTPFYTAVLAFFLQGSREHWSTYGALIPVMAGIAIASGAEIDFHLVGFLLATAATAGRALKSVVQSMLMTDPSEKLDPMSLLLYMSGVSVALLLAMTAVLEPNAFTQAARLYESNNAFLWYLAINAALAYFTNLTNFMVTKYTSALTLQVLGNAKGVVAAVVSVYVFGNIVTVKGMLGYGVTILGVIMYSETKRRVNAEKEVGAIRSGESKADVGERLLGIQDQSAVNRSPFRTPASHVAQA